MTWSGDQRRRMRAWHQTRQWSDHFIFPQRTTCRYCRRHELMLCMRVQRSFEELLFIQGDLGYCVNSIGTSSTTSVLEPRAGVLRVSPWLLPDFRDLSWWSFPITSSLSYCYHHPYLFIFPFLKFRGRNFGKVGWLYHPVLGYKSDTCPNFSYFSYFIVYLFFF